MGSVAYPYTFSDKDRHGNVRWYVRMKLPDGSRAKRRIKATAGTLDWVKEYETHLDELKTLALGIAPRKKETPFSEPGTLAWLIDQYFKSGEFYDLASATQDDKLSILGRVRTRGDISYHAVSRAMITQGRDDRKETPAAANKFVKEMRALYEWAIERGFVTNNPAQGVRNLKIKPKADGTTGWHTWTQDEINQFCAHWPVGSTPRLAFELHYASLRASDVKIIGHQNIRNGYLDFIQVKTKTRAVLPIHADLQACIDDAPRDRLHLVVTSFGKPYKKGYSAAFKRWCQKAGLPDHCTSHGIRKALGANLAENGASEHEIAAHLGQTGTQSVKHYTVAADKKRLAEQAGKRR